MSEKIVEAVARALAQKQLDEGDGLYDWYALTDEVADGYRDLARAAIEAYEAEKIKQAADGLEQVSVVANDGKTYKVSWPKIDGVCVTVVDVVAPKANEPYVTRVEKGVTYWSNGLCSQSVPGSKEFADGYNKWLNDAVNRLAERKP